jgi:hypothetical protein
MDYVKKYRNIINELIKKDFPALKGQNIIVKEKNFIYRAKVSYLPWGMRIIVGEKLRKFPEKSVRRILFHELCHLEIFKREGWFRTNLGWFSWIFKSRESKIKCASEREANVLMIKKGHWKEVMTARKGNITRGLPYALSLEEIKYYMKLYSK